MPGNERNQKPDPSLYTGRELLARGGALLLGLFSNRWLADTVTWQVRMGEEPVLGLGLFTVDIVLTCGIMIQTVRRAF